MDWKVCGIDNQFPSLLNVYSIFTGHNVNGSGGVKFLVLSLNFNWIELKQDLQFPSYKSIHIPLNESQMDYCYFGKISV